MQVLRQLSDRSHAAMLGHKSLARFVEGCPAPGRQGIGRTISGEHAANGCEWRGERAGSGVITNQL